MMNTVETLKASNPEAVVFKFEGPVYEGPRYADLFPEIVEAVVVEGETNIDLEALFEAYGLEYKINEAKKLYNVYLKDCKKVLFRVHYNNKKHTFRIKSAKEFTGAEYHPGWSYKWSELYNSINGLSITIEGILDIDTKEE